VCSQGTTNQPRLREALKDNKGHHVELVNRVTGEVVDKLRKPQYDSTGQYNNIKPS